MEFEEKIAVIKAMAKAYRNLARFYGAEGKEENERLYAEKWLDLYHVIMMFEDEDYAIEMRDIWLPKENH